jgi:hypothetical protein
MKECVVADDAGSFSDCGAGTTSISHQLGLCEAGTD